MLRCWKHLRIAFFFSRISIKITSPAWWTDNEYARRVCKQRWGCDLSPSWFLWPPSLFTIYTFPSSLHPLHDTEQQKCVLNCYHRIVFFLKFNLSCIVWIALLKERFSIVILFIFPFLIFLSPWLPWQHPRDDAEFCQFMTYRPLSRRLSQSCQIFIRQHTSLTTEQLINQAQNSTNQPTATSFQLFIQFIENPSEYMVHQLRKQTSRVAFVLEIMQMATSCAEKKNSWFTFSNKNEMKWKTQRQDSSQRLTRSCSSWYWYPNKLYSIA